jgi:hypothetical protein
VQLSSTTLAAIACAIAVSAGLPVNAVSLHENADGSFIAIVCGVEHTGTFEDVLAWAAEAARAAADRDFEADSAPVEHGMRP